MGTRGKPVFKDIREEIKMNNIKLLIITFFLSTLFSGCSYVSDYIEGQITNRASFELKADYNSTTHVVRLSWDETDTSDGFAGIEIYATSEPNDEYETYELVASPYFHNFGLGSGTTTSYSYTLNALTTPPLSPGVYFYRVAFIHWDEDDSVSYDSETSIDKISGYAKIVIP